MNKLTKKGRQRLYTFLGILVAVALARFALRNTLFVALIDTPLIIFIIILVSKYARLRMQLNTTLQDTILQKMGFTIATDVDVLNNYGLRNRGRMFINRVYLPTTISHPFKLILFTLTKGSGKQKITRHYVGCEFTTQLEHRAVQLFDHYNPFQPAFSKDHQLESTEFNRLFNIYSADPSAPFYFFDPDTMSDLIDLKNKTDFSINMESLQNNIFIYVSASDITKQFKNGFTFYEILNDEITAERFDAYQQSMKQFITQMQTIFATLDYKLKV